MSIETRLKPCPFCGGAARELNRFNANVITCRRCGVKVRQSEMGEGDAAVRWNQRATPVAAQPDLTQQTLDDVKAGIPARDAEIEALRREIETVQAQHAATLSNIKAFVACDASAISYQSLGQYRTALLRILRQAPATKEAGT